MFILYTWFVTTEEHFDMVVGSSVREFSIKRWAWGLFFYSVIKVPNAFYLLNPTPRIAFSIRLLFPHKNTPHHHYVHRPCRRAKVDIWPWRGLKYLVFIYLDLPFPCCWNIAPRFHFLFSFFVHFLHILTTSSHISPFPFFFWCIHFVFWPPHLPFFCFLDMCTDSGEWRPADEPRDQNTGTSTIVIGMHCLKKKR